VHVGITMPRAVAKKQKKAPLIKPEDLDPSTFLCGTCSRLSVKGAVWSAKCRDCGMAIFFKTVAARSDYRTEADAKAKEADIADIYD
jgi:DNA-directed RNA polymerase subunit RPC12/RpoP